MTIKNCRKSIYFIARNPTCFAFASSIRQKQQTAKTLPKPDIARCTKSEISTIRFLPRELWSRGTVYACRLVWETMSHDSIAFWKQRGLGRIRTRSLQRRRKCRRTLWEWFRRYACQKTDRHAQYSAPSTKWVISTWAGAKEASEGWRFDVVEIRLW